MAVYAAHLTRTLNGTPSVFQVTAQEALGATVKPALRKVLEYLSAVWPARLGWAPQWFDELFLLLDAALQYHYLKHYAASFSESFYGLVRSPISSPTEFHSGTRLPASLERGSLVLLVLLPYLRDRLTALVEAWRQKDEDGLLGKSKADQARRAAVRAHALLHFSYETLRLVQLARYLAGGGAGGAGGAGGGARSPTPALLVLGLTLRDAPAPEGAAGWTDLAKDIVRGDFLSAYESLPAVGGLLLRAAEHGAFLVQLLRWWGASGAAAHSAGLPAPPPPQRDEAASRCRNKCPLCLQPWRTPTVLPVSGYIFCYGCIARHLQRAPPACPVTRAPAAPRSLLRAYLPHT